MSSEVSCFILCAWTAYKTVYEAVMHHTMQLCVWMCLVGYGLALNSTTLQPCVVCDALDKFVDNVGGNPSTSCSPKECLSSGKLQMFQRASNSMHSHSFVTIREGVVFTSSLTDEQTAQLLVLSMLGQHLIHTVSDDEMIRGGIFYFEYDVQHQTFQIIKPLCTFQKNVYTALLILSVVVIVVGISFRMIEKKEGAHAETTNESKPFEKTAPHQGIAFAPPKIHLAWANQNNARYRPLSTNVI
jgi:hypothetical protein